VSGEGDQVVANLIEKSNTVAGKERKLGFHRFLLERERER
jgi:hypothetical protein